MRRSFVPIIKKHLNRVNFSRLTLIALLLISYFGFSYFQKTDTPKPPPIKRSESDLYLYEASNDIFSAKIGSQKTSSPSITFNSTPESSITFTLKNGTAKEISQRSNSIIFSDTSPGIDFIYTSLARGIKEEIVIHSPESALSEYLFSVVTNNAEPRSSTTHTFTPYFFDEANNYQFHLEKPYAVDAKGDRTEEITMSIRKSTTHNNAYELRLAISTDWIKSPDRSYPIIIDPTIVHDTTSEFATGTFNRNADTGTGSVPSIETDYQDLTADENTLALWHMDEGTDNTCSGGQDICDSSGNGLHGTFSGNAAFNGSGKVGSDSVILDGTGDYADVAEGARFSTSTFTISAWAIRTSDSGTWEHIVDNRDANADGSMLRILPTDYAECGYNAITISSSFTIPLNQWFFYTCASDGTSLSLYIDGKLESSIAVTGSISETTNLRIGGRNHTSPDYYFPGLIDEVHLSTIARTPEDIKLSASRRPYSVYTSEVIDLGPYNDTWTNLSWTEIGVATGDGETLANSSGLVAKWDFNESSGTTADNSEGTSALDGTLTGFDSTTSQDADPDSTWTADERRWGAGALKFDGLDSYVQIADHNSLSFGSGGTDSPFSIGMWIFPRTIASVTGDWLINKRNADANDEYQLVLTPEGGLSFIVMTGNLNYIGKKSYDGMDPGEWYYIVVTYDGSKTLSGIKTFVNGRRSDVENLSLGTYTGMANGPHPVTIGKAGWSTAYMFDGIIDSTTIFSRELTPAEIMSNYNTADIQFQTRIGSDTSPNDGSWEEWSPTGSETAINDFDTADSNLVSFWPFEDYASSTTIEDRIGSNDGTLTGTQSQVIALHNRGYNFSAGTNYITVPDHSSLDITGDFTLMGWVNRTGGSNGYIINKLAAQGGGGYALLHGNSGEVYCRTDNGTSYTDSYTSTGFVTTSTGWTHVAAVRSGTSCRVYINGVDQTTTANTHTTMTANAQPLKFGARSDDNSSPLFGYIDEFRVFNGALTSSQIKEYMGGSSSYDQLTNSFDTTIKMEGDSSLKLSTGLLKADLHTIGLWRLDETGGSGAYLKDNSGNNNHLTPTGSSLAQGFAGKARSFPDSSSDYLSISSVMSLGTSNVSMEAWVKLDSNSESGAFIKIGTSNGYGVGVGASTFDDSGNNLIGLYEGSRWIDTNVDIGTGWHHVAMTINGSGYPTIYLDGRQIYTDTTGAPTSPTTTTFIGGYTNAGNLRYVDAIIDEVRISNIARNANELAEIYRAGRQHYYSNYFTSTDLSAKSSLPFYVAADRPGAYLTATVGESTHDNLLYDSNVKGFWHLDEPTGSGNYIRDRSGNGNHGTPTGTTFVSGKYGGARIITANTQNIDIPDSTSIRGLTGNFTIEAWVKPSGSAFGTNNTILDIGNYTANTGFGMWVGTTNTLDWRINQTYNNYSTTTLPTNKWSHFVITYNGSTVKMYLNGTQIVSTSFSTNPNQATTGIRIGRREGASTEAFNGAIDQVRVSNVARTAAEVRASYEAGLRTHPITIDFGASLDSGNLIADSNDLSFTVDATVYGLSEKGSMLFPGDKIIVRENYDGTEYKTQGTVTAVTASTGAVTVASWDSGSTFHSGGYTANASVFKWQREYWPIGDNTLSSFMDSITHLKLTLLDGSEGRTIWLDNLRSNSGYLTAPGGSTITSSEGSRYFQYRAILSSIDPAVSATLSAVTLDYNLDTPPNTPILDSPADTANGVLFTPQLQTTATDPESSYLRYKIEMCTNLAMSVNCQTFDQTVSQTGWSGQNTQGNTAYTSGTQAIYTIQSALTEATTYYWRSYAIDPGGSNTFGPTQGTPYSFTTNTRPNIPTLDGPTNGSTGVSTAAVLTTTASDTNNDYLRYKIHLCTNDAMTINCQTFDQTVSQTGWSGQNTQSNTAYTSGAQATYTIQTLLQLNTTYYWRSYAIDPAGSNIFSSTQATPYSFTTVSAPTSPSQCTVTKASDNSEIVINWVDNSISEDGYQIWRVVNGGTPAQLGPNLVPNTVTYTDTAVADNNSYGYLIRSYEIIGATTYYSAFCPTATTHLATGNMRFEGIQFN